MSSWDLEVVRDHGSDVVWTLRNAPTTGNSTWAPDSQATQSIAWHDASQPHSADEWHYVSGPIGDIYDAFPNNLGTDQKYYLRDMAFQGPDTMFVTAMFQEPKVPASGYPAIGKVLRGVRAASGSWAWEALALFPDDPVNGPIGRKQNFGSIIVLQKQRTVILGAFEGFGGRGGLYSFPSDIPTSATTGLVTLLDGDASSDVFLNAAARNVQTVAVDATEDVMYVGTRGLGWYATSSEGWGTVLCADVPPRGQIPATWTVLANETDSTFDYGVPAFLYAGYGNDELEMNRRLTYVRDIAIDPHDPRKIYIALGHSNSLNPSNGVWHYDPSAQQKWSQILGGSGDGVPNAAATVVAINPLAPQRLYAGIGGQEFFEITITLSPHPQITPTAEYPILSDNPDTTTVIAVRIAAPGASGIDTVTIDVSSFADPLYMTLPMLDDGEGDDAKMNDGIFTSPRFVASVPSGTTSLNADVFAQDGDGRYTTTAVTVEVVSSGLKFVDASDDTDKLKTELDDDPYSSIYFKLGSDGTGYPGLMVSFDDAPVNGKRAKLFQQWTLSENEAPRFRTNHFWLGGNAILTPGSRGLSYADFDNDGDQDLFVCQNGSGGNSTRLFLNTGTVSAPSFEDATAAVFGVDQVYLEDAHAASWGDYNRDGFVDLFVATLAYGDQVKSFGGSSPPSGSPYAMHFFKNIQGRRMAKTEFGVAGSADACLSGVWSDLDADGDLDIVTTRFGSGALFVYLNAGYLDVMGDNFLGGDFWPVEGHALWGTTSVSVLDYDHDPYPDLVVVRETDPYEAVILRNRMGEAIPVNGFTYVESLGSGRKWTGSVVGDFDLNGQEDILLVPRTGEPGMYLGESSGQSGQGATFRDLGYTLGLRAGKHLDSVTSGVICADFNGDHDYDLFLGRFKSDPFFYRNVRPGYVNGSVGTDDYPAANQKWVEVDLSTVGNSNASLIGAKVTVSGDGDKKWTQTVSGGSGRGGQGANQLIFGLGNLDESTTSVNVSVSYPSGDADSATIPVGTVWSPEEDTGVTLKSGTKQSPEPASSYELFPGGADWVFKWKTVGIKGDLREDKVEVENGSGYLESSPCYAGIPAGTTEVLSWDRPDVDFKAYWDGNYWQHVVIWRNRPCVSEPACSHRFRVTSGIGDGTLVTSGWAMTKGSGFCIPDVQIEN